MWRKDMSFWPGRFLTIMMLGGILSVRALQAQIAQSYFPADPANLYEWRSALVNPSIGALQSGALELSVKILHYGFADESAALFKSGYIVCNLPRLLPAKFGLGLQTQTFSTPIFRESEFRLQLSRRFFGLFAVGISAGIRNFAYQSANFDLVDPDDPVFANGTSKWQPDIGAGISIIAGSPVIFGIGVQHLNRPDVSLLDDGLKLDPVVSAGISINIGALSVVTGGRKVKQESFPRGSAQLYDESLGLLQLGYSENAIWLRSRLHVVGAVSVGYGLSYPTGDLRNTSSGSHEAQLVYEFARVRNIPRLRVTPTDWKSFQPTMPSITIVPQFSVTGSVSGVDVFSKRIVREIEPDIAAKAFSRLTQFDLGVLDTTVTERIFPFEVQALPQIDSTAKFVGQYSSDYLSSLSHLRADIVDKKVEAVIVAPETQMNRAMAFSNYLNTAMHRVNSNIAVSKLNPLSYAASKLLTGSPVSSLVIPTEELVVLQPRQMSFGIYPIAQATSAFAGQLVVENADGQRVYSQSCEPGRATTIAWDWHTNGGQVIKQGYYRYYIEWKDSDGDTRRSAAQIFYARKLQRNIHMKISKRYEKADGDINKIGVILNK